MSGTFTDDVLMQVTLDAYRVAGAVSKQRLDVRATPGTRPRFLAPGSREPALQQLVNWQALRPAATAALEAIPPGPGGSTVRHIADALERLPTPPGGTTLEPRPEVVALAKSFNLAAEMITTARYRPDFTAEHAVAAADRLTAAVGALSRVSAAVVANTPASKLREHEVARLDALTAECRARPSPLQGPIPGFAPAPGSLPDAISNWCTTTRAALEPRQVDARIMHVVPADLQYLHAATTLVLGASTLNGADPHLDVNRAGAHLADAQTAWAETVRAWPAEAGTQPAGRADHDQLLASQRLHESIRDHLRVGPAWANPAAIADRIDASETLRAIADLGPSITATAQRYADVTDSLIENGQIAFPARRVTHPGEQGLNLIEQVDRGAWISLPESDRAAQDLSAAARGAALVTSTVETTLRHTRTGDFRDLRQQPDLRQQTEKRIDRHSDSPRITGRRM